MHTRHLSIIVFAALVALPASGQIKSSPGDNYVGVSDPKSYPCPTAWLSSALQNSLCPTGEKAKVKQGDKGYELSCDRAGPEQSFAARLKSMVLLGLDDDHETVQAWARVVTSSKGSALVTIGVVLRRNGAKVNTARGHFFKPEAWGKGVWRTLDQCRGS